jgi:MinD-like ATPase involved in chromosome partitioning or flagellar assembly
LYVITFYSFKGGVGRTMALVNVAAELVRRGRTVLVVDFDLEAPGLETYKHLRPQKPHPGLVEYVTEFRRNYEVPNLLDYVYETKPIGKKGGQLWVMPAGRRDNAYRAALADLDWQRLYRDEQGFLLFEDTKAGWKEELKPDYVLIDSRTGDTDVLGICTRQLPDSVVLMFMPNEQNLAGLENVCRDIRREETEGLKKKIGLHFVAANVPDLDDYRCILRRQIKAFRDRLNFEELSGTIRRYENLNLLNQSVFTLDWPRTRLARSYQRLYRMLVKDNLADRDGTLFFLEEYAERVKTRIVRNTGNGDFQSDDKDRLNRIAREFNGDPQILSKVAASFMVEEDHRSAVGVLNRVLELEPKNAYAYWQRAICETNRLEVEKAADDLLACIRFSLSQAEPFATDPLAKLRDIAPERLSEVADLLQAESHPGRNRRIYLKLAGFLCDTEEGIPRAAQLIRAKLLGLSEVGGWLLLRARCWSEFIEFYRTESKDAFSLFALALAHWGEHGEMPEALCREALSLACDEGIPFADFGEAGSLQGVALLSWGIGEVPDAIAYLAKSEQIARAGSELRSFIMGCEKELFSWWRLQGVSIGQYLDDCGLFRRMFKGEPLRPAFLGPPSATMTADRTK